MAGSFSQDFIDRVIQASDAVSIISEHTSLNKRGSRYVGLCPFHNEKTPSFSVSADKQLYYCFGCGAGGNIVSFVTETYKYSFPEAIEYLANKASIPIEYTKGYERNPNNYQKKKVLYQMHKDAANFYYMHLKQNRSAQAYLTNRGLSTDTIRAFALGYAPNERNALYKHLKSKGYSDSDIVESALVRRSQSGGLYDYFYDRIMFPIQDVSENVVAFGGRIFGSGNPKYLNSPETSIFYKHNLLFNLNRAKHSIKEEPIIITEGYMDVISLYNRGIKNACATLGTALSKDHAKLITRFTNNIVLCYDGDNAGKNAAMRGLNILEDAGLSPKVIPLNGVDPDEFISANGKDAFLQLVNQGIYSTDFKINLLKERYDLNDIVQRAEFIKQACIEIARLNDEIKWDYYVKQLSALTQTDVVVIKNQIYKSQSGGSQNDQEEAQFTPSSSSASEYMQASIIKYILESKRNFDIFLRTGGGKYLFLNDNFAELYQQIEQLYKKDELIDIFKGIVYNSGIAFAMARVDSLDDFINQQQMHDYLNALAAQFYESKLKVIKDQIEGSEKSGGDDNAALLKEFGYLKQKLLELKSGGATN